MKKNWIVGPQLLPKDLKLMWMTMKLIGLLVFVGTMAVSASSYSQKTKIDLRVQNVSVSEILQTIEKNTKFIFIYDAGLIEAIEPRSISVRSQPVETILDELFRNTGVGYYIDDRQVFLYQKEEMPGLVPVEAQGVAEQPQKKEITGTVKDEKGNPLPGVSVVLKGTTTGTVTDAAGNYTFQVPLNAQTLVFSFVGMKSQEIQIGNKTVIHVVMAEETMGIEEVVAVGYGTVRRKDLTGSVSSVSGQTLKDIPVTSASQAIVGRMAGVQVTKTEGSPDAEIKIRVRGGGSITQDNSPLYIVDGFPVDNINNIAPTDIASIDILKDASSTAIYGARGANGVILITTKGGFEGKGKVSYNTYFGIKNIIKMLDVLNPYEYVLWQYEQQPTSVSASSPFERYYGSFQDINLYKQLKGHNWQEEIFGRTGTSMYHNLSFSGGSKTSKFNISLTRNDEKEIMIGSGYERTNLNVKTTNQLNNWLSVDLNAMLSDNHQSGQGTSAKNSGYSPLSNIVQYRSVNGLSDYVDTEMSNAAEYDASQSYNRNPLLQTKDSYRNYVDQSFNFNGAINIKISNNIKCRFEYGTAYTKMTNKLFYGLNTANVVDYGNKPIAANQKTDTKSYRLANILTYSKRNIFAPGHNLNVILGQELNNYKSEILQTLVRYFPTYIDPVSALAMMNLGTVQPLTTGDNPANRVSSLFGRLFYDYKGKYLASATFRADGSSKFAPGNQWGYFPSAALAWRISDENFLKFSKRWLSDFKLRASYGESGNNRISDNAWQKTFNVKSVNSGWSAGLFIEGDETTATTYLSPSTILSNPKLKWETTETRNGAVDFGFFKQRLTGSVEVYKNTTKDLLIQATIPASTGYSKQWQNIGQTSNRGLEVTLNGVIVEKNDFRLSASFNIGFNKNRIDKLGDTKQWEQAAGWLGWVGTGTVATDYLIKEGQPVGQMYGYETDGMYSVDDFYYDAAKKDYLLKENVPSNKGLLGALRFWPGTLKFKDQNGDLVVDANDRVVIGDANPKHTGGFNLTGQYKGFDFSLFFNWVYGNDVYNANKLFFTSRPFYLYRNVLDMMNSDNRYMYINKETGLLVSDPVELAEMNKNATIWSPGSMTNLQLHSWVIEDGSFLRLNTVTLGYSLPKSVANKLKVEQLRIYATAYNVWTWTNYSGYDPEVDVVRGTPLTPGVDWCAYPRSRSFNVGLNIEF